MICIVRLLLPALLLSACGSAPQVAQAVSSDQSGVAYQAVSPASRDKGEVGMVSPAEALGRSLAAFPPELIRLDAAQVRSLLRNAVVRPARDAMPQLRWTFDAPKQGVVTVNAWGGIAPTERTAPYEVYRDGLLCIKFQDGSKKYKNCFYVATKKDKMQEYFFAKNIIIDGIGLDERVPAEIRAQQMQWKYFKLTIDR